MVGLAWLLLILVIGGLIVGVVMYLRMHADELQGSSGHKKHVSSAFRAVELKLCNRPCEVGASISGKRYLREDAPALPLPGCPHKHCRCSYIQYEDRRAKNRRDMSFYSVAVGKVREGGDRRKNRGRRAADRARPPQPA
ncbi:MAG: hypothetical protein LBB76_02055 [Azoarcus sp.]|jgi:hypothetical protein|nr:hypothetical protein [Azoarcus sp.]